MKVLSNSEATKLLAKALNKWVLYISFPGPENLGEIIKAAPYLNMDKHLQVIFEGSARIICDSEEECWNLYNQTVGDDGPTELNPYNGPVTVYALVIDNKGQSRTENT